MKYVTLRWREDMNKKLYCVPYDDEFHGASIIICNTGEFNGLIIWTFDVPCKFQVHNYETTLKGKCLGMISAVKILNALFIVHELAIDESGVDWSAFEQEGIALTNRDFEHPVTDEIIKFEEELARI
jgi:hypothetical protein